MARTLQKSKGRKGHDSFVGFPRALAAHPNFIRLSAQAHKLLFDIYQQYWGKNNGDLCAAMKVLKDRGWNSKGTLYRALSELKHYGLIIVTRQGGRNKPSLYAVTWQPIDECMDKHGNSKIDITPTTVVPGNWKEAKPDYMQEKISVPRMRTNLPHIGVVVG